VLYKLLLENEARRGNQNTMTQVEDENIEAVAERVQPEMDSKYRMIIVAAKRSKQLQRGARPRIEIDLQKHKPTRIALEEVLRGLVNFDIIPKKL
jgi:DNA-directed RNA polymerase subunit omega